MDKALEERARRAVYEAGVIVDARTPPSLEVLARACDTMGVARPLALTQALAER